MIDLHCDTLSLLEKSGEELYSNRLCVDLEKLGKAGVTAEFFACFVDMGRFSGSGKIEDAYRYVCGLLEYGKAEFEKNSARIALAESAADYFKFKAEGKISAFLTVEEGGIIGEDINKIDFLYSRGVRLITLCWNHENSIGFPNSEDPAEMEKGLKSFGFDAVEKMNQKGIIIDVSHLSDGGFYDVLKKSRAPVAASHSNARAICPHPRNLSDGMIKALAEKGGIAGVNFYPYFLNQSGTASLEDISEHIMYMHKTGGEDFTAIGTDFDGFDGAPSGIEDIGQAERLFWNLKNRGLTERQIEKISYLNAERIIKSVVK